jgi:hypothetical protein
VSYTGPVLNEVLARAEPIPPGAYADFVELFNPNASGYDIGGMGLSDEADEVKFVFAPGTTIPADGYLVVWCDGTRAAATNGALNSGFSLSGNSGGIYLFNPSGQMVESVEYGHQVEDLPMGRSGGEWHLLSSFTPGTANAPAAALGSMRTCASMSGWRTRRMATIGSNYTISIRSRSASVAFI